MSAAYRIACGLLLGFVQVDITQAAIASSQVLVVHNSASSDSAIILDAYLTAHPEIPAENVLNLNDPALAGVADVSYDDFVNRIRDPIRAYLDLAGDPSASSIISILLIKGIPHRIQDTDNPTVGDVPLSARDEFNAGDYTAAAVDSELALLWQNLESGESGGTMDSRSDNVIDNPYHTRTISIGGYNRANIKNSKTFNNLLGVAWTLGGVNKTRLTEGDMYLVCRIDGHTAQDAIAMIQRAENIRINRRYAWVVLDEHADPTREYDNMDLFDPPNPSYFYAGDDYEETRDLLQTAGWRVRYDDTSTFILPAALPRPVAAYASYGENHINNPPGLGTYLEGFQFARAAVFNTAESYNGRAFNGKGTLFNQEQVADFIALGGTFGIGNVWEPFAFTLPDNEFLFTNFLVNGLSWAEAAWSSIPVLSWMHVVVGDPLATAAIVDQPADFDADGDVDADDSDYIVSCISGAGVVPSFGCEDADLEGDGQIDQADFGRIQRCLSGADVPADPACAD